MMGWLGMHYEFYNRSVVEVARDLLGQKLVVGELEGIITETEAYGGSDDEASHAYRMTKRSAIMFGPPGYTYVYLIYGMYHCLNVVAEDVGQAGAVLIRGLMLPGKIHLNGPGKLCRYLGITQGYNGIDVTCNESLSITHGVPVLDADYIATPRIGISKAVHNPWRFVLKSEMNFEQKFIS